MLRAMESGSFSRSCNFVLFFFGKSVAKASHASFGVLAFRMCFQHFFSRGLWNKYHFACFNFPFSQDTIGIFAAGCVMPLTISQRSSWPVGKTLCTSPACGNFGYWACWFLQLLEGHPLCNEDFNFIEEVLLTNLQNSELLTTQGSSIKVWPWLWY